MFTVRWRDGLLFGFLLNLSCTCTLSFAILLHATVLNLNWRLFTCTALHGNSLLLDLHAHAVQYTGHHGFKTQWDLWHAVIVLKM